jgi:hypothetical protein
MSSRTLSATDHLVADAFASELSAKDEEIERVRETLRNQNWDWTAFQDQPTLTEQVDVVLKTIHDLSADGLTWRQRAVTARADAIKECADKIGEVRNQWLARLPNSDDPTFKHHYQVCADAGAVIVSALESLLNEKGEKDAD